MRSSNRAAGKSDRQTGGTEAKDSPVEGHCGGAWLSEYPWSRTQSGDDEQLGKAMKRAWSGESWTPRKSKVLPV